MAAVNNQSRKCKQSAYLPNPKHVLNHSTYLLYTNTQCNASNNVNSQTSCPVADPGIGGRGGLSSPFVPSLSGPLKSS